MSVTTDRRVRLFKRDAQPGRAGCRRSRASARRNQAANPSTPRPGPPRTSAHAGAAGGGHGLGAGRGLPERDRRAGVQPRTAAALHRHRADRREHRSGSQSFRGRSRLAALRAGAGAVRPQPGGGNAARRAHAVAVPARRRPLVVLRHRPDGVAAGAHQDAATAVVGSDHQQHLHVVFRPALCRRRSALAAQPKRLGGVRPPIRRAVLRRARRLRGSAGRAAVGGRPLHPGRHRRRPVRPALHVPKRRGCSPTVGCWARCTPASPAPTSSSSGSPPAAGERCICSRPERWSTPDRPASIWSRRFLRCTPH